MVALAEKRVASGAVAISEGHLADARGEARLAPRHQLSSSLGDLRRALVDLVPALFKADGLNREQKQAFNDKVSGGLDLPNGYRVRWCHQYGENIEGRLYIEKEGIGVSFRPYPFGDFVYTYSYDQDKGPGQRVKELAHLTSNRGETPVLERLDGWSYDSSSTRSRIEQAPPPAVEIAAAYISVAVTALKNLHRETAQDQSLVSASLSAQGMPAR